MSSAVAELKVDHERAVSDCSERLEHRFAAERDELKRTHESELLQQKQQVRAGLKYQFKPMLASSTFNL